MKRNFLLLTMACLMGVNSAWGREQILPTFVSYDGKTSGFSSTNFTGNDEANNSVQNLFDGDLDTKWCSTTDFNTYVKDKPIVMDAGKTVMVESYEIYNANNTADWPDRRWTSWSLYGSDQPDVNGAWTLLHNTEGVNLKTTNNERHRFTIPEYNRLPFRYYKLVVHSNVKNQQQQMGEFVLVGDNYDYYEKDLVPGNDQYAYSKGKNTIHGRVVVRHTHGNNDSYDTYCICKQPSNKESVNSNSSIYYKNKAGDNVVIAQFATGEGGIQPIQGRAGGGTVGIAWRSLNGMKTTITNSNYGNLDNKTDIECKVSTSNFNLPYDSEDPWMEYAIDGKRYYHHNGAEVTGNFIEFDWEVPSTLNSSFDLYIHWASTNQSTTTVSEGDTFLGTFQPPLTQAPTLSSAIFNPSSTTGGDMVGYVSIPYFTLQTPIRYVDNINGDTVDVDSGTKGGVINLEAADELRYFCAAFEEDVTIMKTDGSSTTERRWTKTNTIEVKPYHAIYDFQVEDMKDSKGCFTLQKQLKWSIRHANQQDIVPSDMFVVERAFQSDFSDAEYVGTPLAWRTSKVNIDTTYTVVDDLSDIKNLYHGQKVYYRVMRTTAKAWQNSMDEVYGKFAWKSETMVQVAQMTFNIPNDTLLTEFFENENNQIKTITVGKALMPYVDTTATYSQDKSVRITAPLQLAAFVGNDGKKFIAPGYYHVMWDEKAKIILTRTTIENGTSVDITIPSDSVQLITDPRPAKMVNAEGNSTQGKIQYMAIRYTEKASRPCMHYSYKIRIDTTNCQLHPMAINYVKGQVYDWTSFDTKGKFAVQSPTIRVGGWNTYVLGRHSKYDINSNYEYYYYRSYNNDIVPIGLTVTNASDGVHLCFVGDQINVKYGYDNKILASGSLFLDYISYPDTRIRLVRVNKLTNDTAVQYLPFTITQDTKQIEYINQTWDMGKTIYYRYEGGSNSDNFTSRYRPSDATYSYRGINCIDKQITDASNYTYTASLIKINCRYKPDGDAKVSYAVQMPEDSLYTSDPMTIDTLSATKEESRFHVLLQMNVDESLFDSLIIERCKAGTNDWVRIASTGADYFLDQEATPGVEYDYRYKGCYSCQNDVFYTDPSPKQTGSIYGFGKIDGYVRTKDGSGLSHMKVVLTNNDTTLVPKKEYICYTNDSGYYHYDTVYYAGKDAVYSVTVSSQSSLEFKTNNGYDKATVRLALHHAEQTASTLYLSSYYRINGRVLYDGSSIPVAYTEFEIRTAETGGRFFKLMSQGEPTKSNLNGEFTVQVPASITGFRVVKPDHVFKDGGYLYMNDTNLLSLTKDISDMRFYDQTKTHLYGRIAGGNVRGKLPIHQGVSENNLGDSITIVLELEGDNISRFVYYEDDKSIVSREEMFYDTIKLENKTRVDETRVNMLRRQMTIHVNNLTGEFSADVYPCRYKVVQMYCKGYASLLPAGQALPIWDMSDSITQPHEINYIYHTEPKLTYKQLLYGVETDMIGLRQMAVTGTNGKTFNMNIVAKDKTTGEIHYTFGYPLFQAQSAQFRVYAKEQYYYNNTVGGQLDEAPLSGPLHVYNGLCSSPETQDYAMDSTGIIDVTLPINNYTFTLTGDDALRQADFSLDYQGQFILAEPLKAYVLGDRKVEGGMMNVLGTGITVMDVLRDPYGKNSYSYMEEGSNFKAHLHEKGQLKLGIDIDLAVGVSGSISSTVVTAPMGGGVSTKVFNSDFKTDIKSKIPIIFSYNYENDYTYNYSNATRIETPKDGTPGAMSDVYIGFSRDMGYYDCQSITIVDSIGLYSIEAALRNGSAKLVASGTDTTGTKYYIVKKSTISMGQEITTNFAYTQDYIINTIIPDILSKRNALLLYYETDAEGKVSASLAAELQAYANTLGRIVYRSTVKPTSKNFGRQGYYEMYFPKNFAGIDEVKCYNRQIVNWCLAIYKNEQLKLSAHEGYAAELNTVALSAGMTDSYRETADYSYSGSAYWVFPKLSDISVSASGSVGSKSPIRRIDTNRDKLNSEAVNAEYAYNPRNLGNVFESAYDGNTKNSNDTYVFTNGGTPDRNKQNTTNMNPAPPVGPSSSVIVDEPGAPLPSQKVADDDPAPLPYPGDETTTGGDDDDDPAPLPEDNRDPAPTPTPDPDVTDDDPAPTPDTDDSTPEDGSGDGEGTEVKITGFSLKFDINPVFEHTCDRDNEQSIGNSRTTGYVIAPGDNSFTNQTIYRTTNATFKDATEKTRTEAFDYNGSRSDDYLSNDFIFYQNGGSTLCPYEPADSAFLIKDAALSVRTLKVENPTIKVNVHEINDLPGDEAAAFSITMANESELGSQVQKGETQAFRLYVQQDSNPYGAEFFIDGAPIGNGLQFDLAPGEKVTKTLMIKRGVGYEFEDLKLVFESDCDPGLCSVTPLSVHYLPTASPISIKSPEDKWVMNTLSSTDEDGYFIPVTISGYDINYENFHHIECQYKLSTEGESHWVNLCSYFANQDYYDEATCNKAMITGGTISNIKFHGERDPMEQNYDIRAVSYSTHGNGFVSRSSEVLSGIKDTRIPEMFGVATPTDGILTFEGAVIIPFSEDINGRYLDKDNNFEVIGGKNGTGSLTTGTTLQFPVEGATAEAVSKRSLKGSYSIEMNVKINETKKHQALFSYRVGDMDEMIFGFRPMKGDSMGLAAFSQNDTIYSKAMTVRPDQGFVHVVMTYDAKDSLVSFYVGNAKLDLASSKKKMKPLNGYGRFRFGSAMHAEVTYVENGTNKKDTKDFPSLNGSMVEARVWNKCLSTAEITHYQNSALTGYEQNLLAYYPMKEAHGNIAYDKAHGANLKLSGTSWKIPEGRSLQVAKADSLVLRERMIESPYSYTLMLWYKAEQDLSKDTVAIFSTAFNNDGDEGLMLGLKKGQMVVMSRGEEVIASTATYNDKDWHHVALVKDDVNKVTRLYVDFELVAQETIKTITELNTNAYLGRNKSGEGKFNGYIGQLSLWQSALPYDFIDQYAHHAPSGEEIGLQLYLPLHHQVLNSNGIYETRPSVLNEVAKRDDETGVVVPLAKKDTAFVGELPESVFSATIIPPVQESTPMEKINYKYMYKDNMLSVNFTEEDKTINKQRIFLTVREVEDLNGNPIQSAITLPLYIDLNRIRWSEYALETEIMEGESAILEAKAQNQCGAVKQYEITTGGSNWLTPVQTRGQLQPKQQDKIQFEISDGLNPGTYSDIVYLTDEGGLSEPLLITVTVKGKEPDYEVDRTKFNHTMNLMGYVLLPSENYAGGRVYDMDENDIVYAVVNNQIVGKEHITVNRDGTSSLYMTIYGNTQTEGKILYLRLWRASSGEIFSLVPIEGDYRSYDPGACIGCDKPLGLTTIEENRIQAIQLNPGWNWISTYLHLDAKGNGNKPSVAIRDGSFSKGDQIKTVSEGNVTTYNATNHTWENEFVLTEKEMYMVYSQTGGQMLIMGTPLTEGQNCVTVGYNGWHPMPYLCATTQSVKDALTDYFDYAKTGDILKSYDEFAVFTDKKQWVGSLEYMRPGVGYYIRSHYDAGVNMCFVNQKNPDSSPKRRTILSPDQLTDSPTYRFNSSNMMPIVAQVAGVDVREGDVLQAYVGDELVGEATMTDSLFFLSAHAANKSQLTYQLVRQGKKTAHAATTTTYKASDSYGTVENPYQIDFRGANAGVSKIIEDEQVIILRDGEKFNMLGGKKL